MKPTSGSRALARAVSRAVLAGAAAWAAGGCATAPPPEPLALPAALAPTTQPAAEALKLDRAGIDPMYRELLPVDLATVTRVAVADNLEIRQARARVDAARGRAEASVEALFPVLTPGLAFERQQGSARAVQGQLVPVDFTSLQASIALQWVLNPTRAWYDVLAARRRLASAEHQEQFARMETLRQATVQYYELALAQSKVNAARQNLSESEELLRIAQLRLKAGAGVTADETRARASAAARRQDLALSINAFYQASVDLALTLRVDPSVTLIPAPSEIRAVALVRRDSPVDELLETALRQRPDLKALRDVVDASTADRKALVWSALAPQLQGTVQEGGLATHVPGDTFGLQEQQRETAGLGWTLGLASLGQYKAATADEHVAFLESAKLFDRVRGQVVKAQQESLVQEGLIPLALEQLTAAQESLRLAQVNLRAGTLTTLDVLAAEDAVAESRVRHAQAVVRYNQSQINLIAALGALDESAFAAATR